MRDALIRRGVWALAAALALLFLLLGSGLDFDYVIPNRLIRLAAMGWPASASQCPR